MIKVENLSKRFGELRVLEDVNVEIGRGEVVSIIGPSGTGKSTFLRCLNLLETPSGGRIEIDGTDILGKGVKITKLRQKMGMVFQAFNLYAHLTVLGNLTLGPVKLLGKTREEADAGAMELLKAVGLSEKAESYPDELSGGQKQRVAIARCLAMDPEIILFDEPTSALDPTMVGEVLGVIRRLVRDGMTMAIVTHEMDFARSVSTRVLYMDEGIIYEAGTPDEIFENPQREKTRAFIQRIRKFQARIAGSGFDLFQLHANIESFCARHTMDKQVVNNILLIAEEMLVHILPPFSGDKGEIDLTLEYSEKKCDFQFHFEYPGRQSNPLTNSEQDHLPLLLVTETAKNINYSFDNGINRVAITL